MRQMHTALYVSFVSAHFKPQLGLQGKINCDSERAFSFIGSGSPACDELPHKLK